MEERNQTPAERPAPTPIWLTEKDVATMLCMKVTLLRKWREMRIGPPFIKVGKCKQSTVRYPADLLEQWTKSFNPVIGVPERECA